MTQRSFQSVCEIVPMMCRQSHGGLVQVAVRQGEVFIQIIYLEQSFCHRRSRKLQTYERFHFAVLMEKV